MGAGRRVRSLRAKAGKARWHSLLAGVNGNQQAVDCVHACFPITFNPPTCPPTCGKRPPTAIITTDPACRLVSRAGGQAPLKSHHPAQTRLVLRPSCSAAGTEPILKMNPMMATFCSAQMAARGRRRQARRREPGVGRGGVQGAPAASRARPPLNHRQPAAFTPPVAASTHLSPPASP